MTKKLFDDPELKDFKARFARQPAGRRYISAWTELVYAQKRIVHGRTLHQDEIAIFRSEYIEASNACTVQLQALEDQFGWPIATSKSES